MRLRNIPYFFKKISQKIGIFSTLACFKLSDQNLLKSKFEAFFLLIARWVHSWLACLELLNFN